jgi:hypothetical protein
LASKIKEINQCTDEIANKALIKIEKINDSLILMNKQA